MSEPPLIARPLTGRPLTERPASANVLASLAPDLRELGPFIRRTVALDANAVARLRTGADTAVALARLPFDVLAGRTIRLDRPVATELDIAVRGAQFVAWLDGERADPPEPADIAWLGTVPPDAGWRRIETVPDAVARGLVRAGALALKEAAAREGVPHAQPRAEVTDALLDSIVLTVDDGANRIEVKLRLLSALTRMGFLARGSHLAVDLAGRWIRIAADYGSVYTERPGLGLGVVTPR